MPPRGRSKTQQSGEGEDATVDSPVDSSVSSKLLPPPDPAAVQRLVDHAIKRAHSSRGTTPTRRTRSHNNDGLVLQAWNHLFGNTAIEYNRKTTSKLTDAVGMFLVVIFAFYFTAAGYLFYRENALAA